MNRSIFIIGFLALLLMSSCRLADLRTRTVKQQGVTQSSEEKGKALLDEAWRAQGMDRLRAHQVYETTLKDHWRGPLGKIAKLWPDPDTDFRFRYAVNTFESQMTYLSGEKKGQVAGLQSWNYYEQAGDGKMNFEVEKNANATFGMAAFQYFFELPDRLRDAPIITYAGEHEALGQKYDLVFVTWKKPEPTPMIDHYRLWINKNTKLLEVAEFTIRDAPQKLPGSKSLYGSIWFQDFQDVDGIMIPFQQYIFANKPEKNPEKYLHKLTVKEFAFDGFDVAELYPKTGLPRIGDDKVGVGE